MKHISLVSNYYNWFGAWLLSGALEVWSLRLRLRLNKIIKSSDYSDTNNS